MARVVADSVAVCILKVVRISSNGCCICWWGLYSRIIVCIRGDGLRPSLLVRLELNLYFFSSHVVLPCYSVIGERSVVIIHRCEFLQSRCR
mgnify:FL=1